MGVGLIVLISRVDPNVLNEPTRPERRAAGAAWLRRHEQAVAVDPIILGEIRFGILLLPRGFRKLHCVPWEAETGLRWAALLARRRPLDAHPRQPDRVERPRPSIHRGHSQRTRL